MDMPRTFAPLVRLIAVTALAVSATSCAIYPETPVWQTRMEKGKHIKNLSEQSVLRKARQTTVDHGLPQAREELLVDLKELDAENGLLETRLALATANPPMVFDDAIRKMPKSERAKVGFLMVPGMRRGVDDPHTSKELLDAAAGECRKYGFSSVVVDTIPDGPAVTNAPLFAPQFEEMIRKKDSVIIVTASKGATDLVQYLFFEGKELEPELRSKIKMIFTLAGPLQGSYMAHWATTSPRFVPFLIRITAGRPPYRRRIVAIREMGTSLWGKDEENAWLAQSYPNLTWVSLVMVSDGPDGLIGDTPYWPPSLLERVYYTSRLYSPNDGLVESAAAVLPPGTGVPQWVVRGRGAHAVPLGKYPDGTPIAGNTQGDVRDDINPEAGQEMFSALLRSLPQSVLK